MKLDGKIAVITGGTNGTGRAAARLFVREGAHVYLPGRGQEGLDAMAAELGSGVTAVRADSASPGDLDRLYEVIRGRHGRVDVVYANAGHGEFATLAETTPELVDRILSVNVLGTLLTVQKALPMMPDGASVTAGRRRSERRRQTAMALLVVVGHPASVAEPNSAMSEPE